MLDASHTTFRLLNVFSIFVVVFFLRFGFGTSTRAMLHIPDTNVYVARDVSIYGFAYVCVCECGGNARHCAVVRVNFPNDAKYWP